MGSVHGSPWVFFHFWEGWGLMLGPDRSSGVEGLQVLGVGGRDVLGLVLGVLDDGGGGGITGWGVEVVVELFGELLRVNVVNRAAKDHWVKPIMEAFVPTVLDFRFFLISTDCSSGREEHEGVRTGSEGPPDGFVQPSLCPFWLHARSPVHVVSSVVQWTESSP